MIVISIPNYPVFFPEIPIAFVALDLCVISLEKTSSKWISKRILQYIPFRDISSFRKEIVFYFARLISKFLTVGRSWSGSFTPPYRSVVTRCAAISLESPLFHRDWARCSRAENGALWKTSYAPARYGKRVPTRTKVHADPVHTMLCTRLVCRRFVSFRDRLFFFFVFRTKERDKFSVFERVWECLQMFVVLQSLISGVFRV